MQIRGTRAAWGIIGAACVLNCPSAGTQEEPKAANPLPAKLRFEVTLPTSMASAPQDGRLFVVMSARGNSEPRFSIGRTGRDAPPVVAKDVKQLAPGRAATLDRSAIVFPLARIGALPAGDYTVQAVFAINRDLRSLNSAGNFFSKPVKTHLDPMQPQPVKLELTEQIGPEKLPPDTEYVRYIKLQSALLTKFWGRPIFLRAGVVLPRDFDREAPRKYPLWVRIGGFGTRYNRAGGMMREGSDFRKMWLAEDTPRFLVLQLDGDGPYGDPYQVNSANNGPYGDAVTQELIPYVERTFRGIGQSYSRVLDGGSTGGWVSLALQIFYPDFFNGTWSVSPDPVDFRAYELVNIYEDKNAYVNRQGFERASERQINGETVFTMRHECQMENMLGAGDSYITSGGQWCAWNATFGRRGPEGRPIPLWDPQTGVINSQEAEYWKQYDLRLYLEANWKTLAPKLAGKIHLWVGDADNYFLNNAVHLLDASLAKADPPFEGSIKYGAGKGHTWTDLSDRQMLEQMQTAVTKGRAH